MNRFCALSTEELDRIEGGILPIIAVAAGGLLLSGCIESTDDIEGREPLPGFNKFLDETQRLAGLR